MYGISRSDNAVDPRWWNALPRKRALSSQLNEKSTSFSPLNWSHSSPASTPRTMRVMSSGRSG